MLFSVSMKPLPLQLIPITCCPLCVALVKREPPSSLKLSFKYWSTLFRYPAAPDSPGGGDITASVFPHRTGSVSSSNFHGPLLDPLHTAHNLWSAGNWTWHSAPGLAWLALRGMTMSQPLMVLHTLPKTDLSLLLRHHRLTCRLCPPGPLKQGSFPPTLIITNAKKHQLVLESVKY